jgi:hypothetical protein
LSSLDGGDEVFSTWDEAFESFDEMGLHENLLRGIYAYGKTFDSMNCFSGCIG